jgi:excisionase family DNA binding protein
MKADEMHFPDPSEVPPESIAVVITRLASLQSALAARLLMIPSAPGHQEFNPNEEDDLLTTADAARMLNVSEDWIYRRSGRLPFTRRLSRKSLRFSKSGLLKWRAARAG